MTVRASRLFLVVWVTAAVVATVGWWGFLIVAALELSEMLR